MEFHRFVTAVEERSERHQHAPAVTHDAEEQVADLCAVQMACDGCLGIFVNVG